MFSLVLECPERQTAHQDSPSPTTTTSGRTRGWRARLVTPLQTSEEPAVKGKTQQKRRKRRREKQKYIMPCQMFLTRCLSESTEHLEQDRCDEREEVSTNHCTQESIPILALMVSHTHFSPGWMYLLIIKCSCYQPAELSECITECKCV